MGAISELMMSNASVVLAVNISEIPPPNPSLPADLYNRIAPFVSWLAMAGLIAGVIGLIICGIMMIMGRRGKNQTAVEGAIGIPWVLAGLTIIALSSFLVGQVFQVGVAP